MEQLTFLDEPIIERYIIDNGRSVFALTFKNGRVIDAPRYATWSDGVLKTSVLGWYRRNGFRIEQISLPVETGDSVLSADGIAANQVKEP